MDELDIHFKLLGGLPIQIDQAGTLTIPTLQTITELNMSVYNAYLAAMLIDKETIRSDWAKPLSNFDIFFAYCYQDEMFKYHAFAAIELFFGEKAILLEGEDNVFIGIGQGQINHNNFDTIQTVIKLGNNVEIQNEPEFNPANSRAAKMIEEMLKEDAKRPKPKEKVDLHSIVAGLAWKNNGLSLFDLFKLNIYQIYNGLYVTNSIDNYRHTITALYAGTIDGKNIKLSDIHWANKLKQ
ncbi:UNVERIFIED_CONTAM: hypothetical protein ABIC26_002858 [Paenibacillus sp. PvR008]